MNLKPRNLTLLVDWLKKSLKPSSLKASKTSSKRNLLEAIIHQTPMGRMTTPLTKPIRLLETKAVKALIGRGLTITTGLFGGPPPKGSLTWEGWTKGLRPNRSPTSSPHKLPTETTCRGNKGKPSSYSFTFPASLCLPQLREHPEGREAKVFSPVLGTLNIRPVDPQHCEGLQTRTYRGSQAVKASFPTSFECQSACPGRGRDCQPLRQDSHTASSLPLQSLLQQPFPSGEERGRATPSDKLVHTKLICAPPTFQDGGLEGGCGQSSSSRLHVQNQPQGRIFCGSHPPGTPKATLLSVQECNLPVQMPTLRSHLSTSGLHKSAEAPDSLCQETGSKDMYLPRRHANPKFSEGGSYERCITNAPPVGKSGGPCEYGEIYSIPFTGNGILRCSGQLHSHELFPPGKQSPEPPEQLQKTSKFQDCLTVRSSMLNWQNDSSKGSNFPGSTPLQGTSTPEELLRPPGSPPPSEGNSRHRSSVRPEMVGNQPGHNQLQTSEASPSRPANPVGCFRVGLGGCVQQD